MDTEEYVEVKEVTTPLPDYFSYKPCEETFVQKTYKLDFVKRRVESVIVSRMEHNNIIKVFIFITSKHLYYLRTSYIKIYY